ADALENQIARHFENRVAQEEQSRAEAEHRFAESKLAVHLQRRESDVDSIEIRHKVEHEQKRDQPASRLRQRGLGKARLRGSLEWANFVDPTIMFSLSHSASNQPLLYTPAKRKAIRISEPRRGCARYVARIEVSAHVPKRDVAFPHHLGG